MIVILGPTASGKSDVAVFLAKKINGEIISADSRQVYRGLDIGTGKIARREMHGIPHYCLDIANPQKQISVVEYRHCAENAIKKILQKKKIPILVGGSGMYIDAVVYGAPYPAVPPNKKLRAQLERKSAAILFAELQKKDPFRAKIIDRRNKRRLVRALEIIAATGLPVPPLVKTPKYNALFLGIKKSRAKLHRLIDTRLQKRLRKGMVAETKKLLASGVSYKRLWDLGLEYRYISEYLKGTYTKKELVEKLSRAIKQFSKRQMTWFRQYPQTRWIQNKTEALRLCKKFLNPILRG